MIFPRSTRRCLQVFGSGSLQKNQEERQVTSMMRTRRSLLTPSVQALRNITAGSERASEYHRFMIGAVEFIFFPNLLHPKKEQEIHQGRKRIDILVENGAREGIFYRIPTIRKLPCAYIPFECKNYTTEVANPELDQIAWPIFGKSGQVGISLLSKL